METSKVCYVKVRLKNEKEKKTNPRFVPPQSVAPKPPLERRPSQRCNLCGKVLDMWDVQEDFSIRRHLGYGTIYDGDKLVLNLCCDCMEDIIAQCKISPIISVNYT